MLTFTPWQVAHYVAFHKKAGTSPRLTTQPPPSIMWQASTHPPASRTTITCNNNEHDTSTGNIIFDNLPNLLTFPVPYSRASIGPHWFPPGHSLSILIGQRSLSIGGSHLL